MAKREANVKISNDKVIGDRKSADKWIGTRRGPLANGPRRGGLIGKRSGIGNSWGK